MARENLDPIIRDLYICRQMAKITIADLATRANISKSTISDAENGYHVPSLTIIRRWADALGFDITLGERE